MTSDTGFFLVKVVLSTAVLGLGVWVFEKIGFLK
jgi:hypothetical protein